MWDGVRQTLWLWGVQKCVCVCVCGAGACVCVHADEWLHLQRNMFVFFSLLTIGTVFSVIHICCTFAVHSKVIVFPLFKSFENWQKSAFLYLNTMHSRYYHIDFKMVILCIAYAKINHIWTIDYIRYRYINVQKWLPHCWTTFQAYFHTMSLEKIIDQNTMNNNKHFTACIPWILS